MDQQLVVGQVATDTQTKGEWDWRRVNVIPGVLFSMPEYWRITSPPTNSSGAVSFLLDPNNQQSLSAKISIELYQNASNVELESWMDTQSDFMSSREHDHVVAPLSDAKGLFEQASKTVDNHIGLEQTLAGEGGWSHSVFIPNGDTILVIRIGNKVDNRGDRYAKELLQTFDRIVSTIRFVIHGQRYVDMYERFSFDLPLDWSVEQDSDVIRLTSLLTREEIRKNPDSEIPNGDIVVAVYQNPKSLSMEAFFNGENAENYFNSAGSIENIVVDGKPGRKFNGVQGMVGSNVVVLPAGGYFVELNAGGTGFDVFENIIDTFTFLNKSFVSFVPEGVLRRKQETVASGNYRNQEGQFQLNLPRLFDHYIVVEAYQKYEGIEIVSYGFEVDTSGASWSSPFFEAFVVTAYPRQWWDRNVIVKTVVANGKEYSSAYEKKYYSDVLSFGVFVAKNDAYAFVWNRGQDCPGPGVDSSYCQLRNSVSDLMSSFKTTP